MIKIYQNEPALTYDIHALAGAFFTGDICVVTPETEVRDRKIRGTYPDIVINVCENGAEVKIYDTADIREQQKNAGTQYTADAACKAMPCSNGSGIQDIMLGEPYREAERKLPEKCRITVYRSSSAGWKKRADRNPFKLFLYDCLCSFCGRTLPWGDITGIRPTKIALGMLEEAAASGDGGSSIDDRIIRYMKDTHEVSDRKAELALDVARREYDILRGLHLGENGGPDGYSIYIGIPFCPTTCMYCSFTSYPICVWKDRIDEYLNALFREMEATAEAHRGEPLDTVYIGGGTPTALTAEELEKLLSGIRKIFDLSELKEFTVEAGRADSITSDKLKVMKENGVTRISVNPQTMKQETLDFIGRKHTVEQVRTAYHMARQAGFDNINMDIILGLPGENDSDVEETMRQIREMGPDSLTAHSLAIKKASALNRWIEKNGVPVLHNTDETVEIVRNSAAEMGMKPYYLYRQKHMTGNMENVGYARDGRYGIYNILIMEERQTIVALGAGSITKRVFRGNGGRIERCENARDVDVYISNIEEMISRKERLFEME
jgi:coproporphyrinogen dehydrogenase HemZ